MSVTATIHAGRRIPVKDNSIQYLGYYLIEWGGYEYVFHDFNRAVAFCWKQGIDPNKVIQTNSPEIYVRCKELAKSRLNELDRTKELLQKAFYDAIAEADKLDADVKRLEEAQEQKRDLLTHVECEVKKEYRIRQSGVVHGVHTAMKALDAQRDPYFSIVWNVNSWRKR